MCSVYFLKVKADCTAGVDGNVDGIAAEGGDAVRTGGTQELPAVSVTQAGGSAGGVSNLQDAAAGDAAPAPGKSAAASTRPNSVLILLITVLLAAAITAGPAW